MRKSLTILLTLVTILILATTAFVFSGCGGTTTEPNSPGCAAPDATACPEGQTCCDKLTSQDAQSCVSEEEVAHETKCVSDTGCAITNATPCPEGQTCCSDGLSEDYQACVSEEDIVHGVAC